MKQLLFLVLAICSTNCDWDIGIKEDLFNILNGLIPAIFNASDVNPNNVSFYLSTRANPQPNLVTEANLTSIDTSKKLKFVVHGYLGRPDVDIYVAIKDAYLVKEDCNVILVDWSGLAAQRYTQSAQNTKQVGKIIANFIISLNISFGNVHLIGHSLGGHTVGFAGKSIQNLTGQKLDRITGLDPAGPFFNFASSADRIYETDAILVDIVHTDGGVFGYYDQTGKVDFYPNGGTALQPGCPELSLTLSVEDIIIDTVICSHAKSCEFFRKSINNPTIKSRRCSNYFKYRFGFCASEPQIVFGEDMDPAAPYGTYYLNIQ